MISDSDNAMNIMWVAEISSDRVVRGGVFEDVIWAATWVIGRSSLYNDLGSGDSGQRKQQVQRPLRENELDAAGVSRAQGAQKKLVWANLGEGSWGLATPGLEHHPEQFRF